VSSPEIPPAGIPPITADPSPGGGWLAAGLSLGLVALLAAWVLFIFVVPIAVLGAILSLVAVGVFRERGARSWPGWLGVGMNLAAIAVSVGLWFTFGAPISAG
jgi:hypothetical protein